MNHQATLSSQGNDSWEDGKRCAVGGVVVVQQLVERDQGARPAHPGTAVNQDGTFGTGVDTCLDLLKSFRQQTVCLRRSREAYLVLGEESLPYGQGPAAAEGCPALTDPATALSAAASTLFCFHQGVSERMSCK